jgi:uncharacterized Zn finger protein
MGRYSSYSEGEWAPYVSVAERKAKAANYNDSLKKKGIKMNPIIIEGRTIAKTFWGKAWCENLENYSDYQNRLPRGRTYVRNGSVIDLQIKANEIHAKVMGSSLYKVLIKIRPLAEEKWKALIQTCTGKIDSLVELLKGNFSKSIMEIMTRKETGLFPSTKEISLKCSCPDGASMCKHVAAVLYGVGASLDNQPEWLFTLRNVNHMDLIASANIETITQCGVNENALIEEDLSALFGIEIESDTKAVKTKTSKPRVARVTKKPDAAPKKNQLTSKPKRAAVKPKVNLDKKETKPGR